jgi:hypothetical protein
MAAERASGASMRFGFLVVAAAASGAVSVTAVPMMIPQGITFPSVVRALGGDPAQFSISLDELNPAKIYADVMQKTLSAPIGAPINIGSSSCDPDYPLSFAHGCRHDLPTFGRMQPHVVKIDDAEMKRAMAASINAQIQQSYRRSQDLQAYARDPMGWHGPPPQ